MGLSIEVYCFGVLSIGDLLKLELSPILFSEVESLGDEMPPSVSLSR